MLAGLETEETQSFDRTQDKFAICNSQSTAKSQSLLEYLEQANLFIVPLDNERRWYRYHHLFAELLRQRWKQSLASSAPSERTEMEALHIRASQWFEENGLELEAFQQIAGDFSFSTNSRTSHLTPPRSTERTRNRSAATARPDPKGF